MNDVLKVIQSRRSVRTYQPQQINETDLNLIIEAGIYAPTAHNDQPWHFTVIQNPALLSRINEKAKEIMAQSEVEWIQKLGSDPAYQLTYRAPTLIIVSGRTDAMAWRVDCAAAIQNMLLASESLNIGSVWLGLLRFFFQQQEELTALDIPDGYQPYYGVALGYKGDDRQQPAPTRNREVVNYIR